MLKCFTRLYEDGEIFFHELFHFCCFFFSFFFYVQPYCVLLCITDLDIEGRICNKIRYPPTIVM